MNIIDELQKPNLIAECPNCHDEFQLSKTILFDGTKQFPPKAEKKKLTLTEELSEQNQKIKDRLDALKKGKKIYGVTTGFGDLSKVTIDAENRQKLQLNLVRSHATGVGKSFDLGITRLILLLKLSNLTSFLESKITTLAPA